MNPITSLTITDWLNVLVRLGAASVILTLIVSAGVAVIYMMGWYLLSLFGG